MREEYSLDVKVRHSDKAVIPINIGYGENGRAIDRYDLCMRVINLPDDTVLIHERTDSNPLK